MNKLIYLSIASCLAMSGCASTSEPVAYDSSHSRAYNIAQAGGLYGVKDHLIPREEYESLKLTTNTATNTLLLTSSFGAGMNLGAGLGVGLLMSIFEQPGVTERNSIMAWMPRSEATSPEEAQAKLIDLMKDAMESTLKEMGLGYDVTRSYSGNKVEFYFHSEEFGCPEWQKGMTSKDICYISTKIYEPREAVSPSFVGSEMNGYAFKSNHSVYYQRFRIIPGRDSHIPTDQMYAAVSSKLPEWVYLYIASGNIQVGDATVTVPYLLEKGQANLFIYHDN